MFRYLQAVRQVSQRTISSSSQRAIRNRVPELQKLFQEDNGIPVHLKRGIGDVLLYRLTMVIGIAGVLTAIYQLIGYSQPKKQ